MADRGSGADEVADDFLTQLDRAQRRHFVALERALTAKERDLRWYHGVGQHVGGLRGEQDRFKYGASFMRRAATALKVSRDLLAKTLAFVERFPNETDLAELEGLKPPWRAVVATMALGERDAQFALLREAARDDWAISRIQIEVRQRLGDDRPRRTGRRHRPPAVDAPAVELGALTRKAKEFGSYLEARWAEDEPAVLAGLRRTRRPLAAALRRLLTQAEEALGAVALRIDRLRTGLRAAASNGSGPERY
jgi:hypothetical protein